MICDSEISKKKRLPNYLNWLNSTTGRNENQLYLQLFIAFDG